VSRLEITPPRVRRPVRSRWVPGRLTPPGSATHRAASPKRRNSPAPNSSAVSWSDARFWPGCLACAVSGQQSPSPIFSMRLGSLAKMHAASLALLRLACRRAGSGRAAAITPYRFFQTAGGRGRASRRLFGFSLPRSAVRREVGALRRSRPTFFRHGQRIGLPDVPQRNAGTLRTTHRALSVSGADSCRRRAAAHHFPPSRAAGWNQPFRASGFAFGATWNHVPPAQGVAIGAGLTKPFRVC